jgi:hypothetical protein
VNEIFWSYDVLYFNYICIYVDLYVHSCERKRRLISMQNNIHLQSSGVFRRSLLIIEFTSWKCTHSAWSLKVHCIVDKKTRHFEPYPESIQSCPHLHMLFVFDQV